MITVRCSLVNKSPGIESRSAVAPGTHQLAAAHEEQAVVATAAAAAAAAAAAIFSGA